jgi:hypothetical protein
MLTSGVVLLHDNVLRILKQLLVLKQCWSISTPYSPDLSLRDYHLFTYLKKWL